MALSNKFILQPNSKPLGLSSTPKMSMCKFKYNLHCNKMEQGQTRFNSRSCNWIGVNFGILYLKNHIKNNSIINYGQASIIVVFSTFNHANTTMQYPYINLLLISWKI